MKLCRNSAKQTLIWEEHMRISACIIARNEGENIAKCLNSIKAAVDEIIFVDAGCMDNTAQVAEQLGAAIVHFEWGDDFAAARNYALDQASGDWIIFLDADEWFSENAAELIIKVIGLVDKDEAVECLLCERKSYTKNNLYITEKVPRIFRKASSIRYVGDVYEQLMKSGKLLHDRMVAAELFYIHHSGHSPEFFKEELRILEQNAAGSKPDAFTNHHLAEVYTFVKNYAAALQCAKLAMKTNAAPLNHPVAIKPYLAMIEAMYNLPGYSSWQLLALTKAALHKFPEHPELYYWRGRVLTRQEKLTSALTAYLKAIHCNHTYQGVYRNYFLLVLPDVHYQTACIYQAKNETALAADYYRLALHSDKYNETFLAKYLLHQPRPVQENTMADLKVLYDKGNKRDAEFITRQFSLSLLGEKTGEFLKPFKDSLKNSDNEISEIVEFFARHMYRRAFDLLRTYLSQHENPLLEQYFAAACILSGDITLFEIFLASTNSQFRNVAAAYFGKTATRKMDDEDSAAFCVLLKAVLPFANDTQINRFLALAKYLSAGNLAKIGEALTEGQKYSKAIEYYQQALNEDNEPQKCAFLCSKVCIAQYKLHNYEKAVEEFLQYSYIGYELCEYLDWVSEKSNDPLLKKRAEILKIALLLRTMEAEGVEKRLLLGCGPNSRDGWINLDIARLDGVDVVADLNHCGEVKLPFSDSSITEIYAHHLLEHIDNILPLLQELHRIAKPGALAVLSVPYGSSDAAYENPGHVRQFFLKSFEYFSQLAYWRADHHYQGDWQAVKITLVVDEARCKEKSVAEIMQEIHHQRNIVHEMIVEMKAVKPIREYGKERSVQPQVDIRLINFK